MKVKIWPDFGKEAGQGGIKRVYEAQHRWLPEYGIELVKTEEQADLIAVHADDYKTDRPVAYHCHGLYWDGYKWPQWAYNANAKIIRAMTRAAGVSVPSQFVGHTLARGMLLPTTTLYHGVDLEDWEPQQHEGYILWAKNRPDPICDPAPIGILARLCPDLQFISTFGEPSHNLRITGRLLYEESKKLIERAGVYLATVQETGGITVLEAMACGVPPVGFRHGANTELIEHEVTGYLAEPGDYADLEEGIRYALHHRKRLGQNARERVREQFQWKDRIAHYIPFYEGILNEEVGRPTVSVVITAHNLADYLPDCIDSVLAQDFEDFEIIIVDDASPDACGEIADGYSQRDSRIKVIHNQTNAYLAEARNIGIRASRGKYIQPLDADDKLGPYTLRIFAQTLNEDRDTDIVTGDFWLVEPDGKEWQSGWPPKNPSYNQQIMKRNQVFYASMYRRWVWERTGGYRRRMKSAEDAEFWTRAMSYGAIPKKVGDFPSLIYSNRPGSMSHTVSEPIWNSWFIWARYPEFTPFGASGTPTEGVSWPVLSYAPAETTVVIPVGPGHDWYLQDCLDSLVSQTMQNWRAIVVNDTGKKWFDESKLINPYLQGFPYIQIIDSEGEPHGPAWARNRGIKEVHTDSFVLLDADDIAQPLLLDMLYKAWKFHGGWIYTDWFDQDGAHKTALDWDSKKFISKMLGPITGIYPTAAWRAGCQFDETMESWEDWDFQLSLMEAGECGMRLGVPGFTYRYHTGTKREYGFAHKETLLKYIQKKHKRLYEDEVYMAGCCGGKGRKTLAVVDNPISSNLTSGLEQGMVIMEYIGPQEQEVRVNSRYAKGIKYLYSKGKQFGVYKEDAEWLARNKDFRVVRIVEEVAAIKTEAPQLTAETRSPLPHTQERSVDSLNLPSLVIGILKREGFTTVEELDYAQDQELLLHKGISDKRLAQIRKAIRELQIQR
jgi:glycosyltransferase involved in cell wall biosynthesis